MSADYQSKLFLYLENTLSTSHDVNGAYSKAAISFGEYWLMKIFSSEAPVWIISEMFLIVRRSVFLLHTASNFFENAVRFIVFRLQWTLSKYSNAFTIGIPLYSSLIIDFGMISVLLLIIVKLFFNDASFNISFACRMLLASSEGNSSRIFLMDSKCSE